MSDKYIESIKIEDTGYKYICVCGERHGCEDSLINKDRDLEIKDCPNCDKRTYDFHRYH